jgi:glycosyltransferase involved in cell wall biosynthesis
MKDTQRVTIGISTHNRIELLKKTLPTIQNQSYDNIQIRISCHKCTDGTFEYLTNQKKDDSRLYFFRCEDDIFYYGLNEALVGGGDDFCAIGSDDDLYEQAWLEEMLKALLNAPSAGFAYCADDCIDSEGLLLKKGRMPFANHMKLARDSFHAELRHHFVRGPGVLMRSEVFRRAGMIYPEYIYGDPFLFIGMTRLARAVYVPQILYHYRVHSRSMTNNNMIDIVDNTRKLMRTYNLALEHYNLTAEESIDFLEALWRGFFVSVPYADDAVIRDIITEYEPIWRGVKNAKIKSMLKLGSYYPFLMKLVVKLFKKVAAKSERSSNSRILGGPPVIW